MRQSQPIPRYNLIRIDVRQESKSIRRMKFKNLRAAAPVVSTRCKSDSRSRPLHV